MTYNDLLTAMAVLGDALGMALPAKALSETLLLRAHYAKGVKEWQTMTEQVQKDMPRNDGEGADEYAKRLGGVLAQKVGEECAVEWRRLSRAAFEELCGVCPEAVHEGEWLSLNYGAALTYGLAGVYGELDGIYERINELERRIG